jgi:toxin ParE1/3/4
MPGLIWSGPARQDLRTINSWLRDNRSPDVAQRRLVSLRARADLLTRFPHAGRPVGDGFRVLKIYDTPYLLVYQLGEQDVEIVRIRHEREDWLVTR